MKKHKQNRGLGLLADRKYAYMFFIKKERPHTRVEWTYCHYFDMEKLSERCLLFVVLMERLLKYIPENDSRVQEWQELIYMAKKWNEDKTSEDNNETHHSSRTQESTQRSIRKETSSRNSNNMNSRCTPQQKLMMLQRQTKERSKKILNDVSHFARMTHVDRNDRMLHSKC